MEGLPEDAHDVIDKVMEYEPKLLVPNIDDHVFSNDEGIDDNRPNDEEHELSVNVGGEIVRPCLMYLVKVGWDKLGEMNVKKIRMVAEQEEDIDSVFYWKSVKNEMRHNGKQHTTQEGRCRSCRMGIVFT